jgi:hypothetical protein
MRVAGHFAFPIILISFDSPLKPGNYRASLIPRQFSIRGW